MEELFAEIEELFKEFCRKADELIQTHEKIERAKEAVNDDR